MEGGVMSEVKLAIKKLEQLRKWSDRIGSDEKSELYDIISLLRHVKNEEIGNYDKLNQKRIINLLLEFDQNPITSNFNQFLKWRYKK